MKNSEIICKAGRGRQQGFNLIEVLVAMMLISIVLFSICSLLVYSSSTMNKTRGQTESTVRLYGLAELIDTFNVANTVKPKISVTGGDNNVLFDKTEERAIYRVEWMALDCRDDGQPGWQWYRVTSRGLDASGSRTYLQEYVKVPVSCKKDIRVDETPEVAGSSDGTRNKRF